MPWARNGDVDIYYETYGTGNDCVVLAHGAGGNAACWWQQIPHLSQRFRVIAFDHRNFARSPCEPEQVGVSHFAGDLRSVLDRERVARCFLVCQSMGGWTGLGFSLESPDRVRAWC